MLLVCIRPFGNFVPGDEVQVPEGAVYDGAYFELVTAASSEKEND